MSDLRHFIALLESADELVRVTVETDPILEIAAITDRVCKNPGGGPALLFERPIGSAFPVATNLFGSLRRTACALGVDSLDRLTEKLTALLDRIPEIDLNKLDTQMACLPAFSRFSPTSSSSGGYIVVEQPDLTAFPFLKSWPHDGAASGNPRYITLPQIFTAEPDGSTPNCGMYRAQVIGPRQLAIRWKPGSGAARHLEEFRLGKTVMPVALALGGPPALLFSAMMPLPGNLDEVTFAGFLSGAALEMIACRTVPLSVPATSEVVIEGFVDPAETAIEGPFGNHTGSYSPPDSAALMSITAISHRPNAIIPATVVGPPPMEDCFMATAWERILLAFLKKCIPSVADIHFPLEWIFQQSAMISLEHPKPGMVREIVGRLWEMPWFSQSRLLVFIDAGDGIDPRLIAWRCINLVDMAHDMIHDACHKRTALDATGCRLPRMAVRPDSPTKEHVLKNWHNYGIFLK